jgi:hypothetical protein
MPAFAPVERPEDAEPVAVVVGALPEVADVGDDVGEPVAVAIVDVAIVDFAIVDA